MLLLGSADDLLRNPGCGVCRYAAEASDQHLAWFALEAHADPITINRLCASLGMCPGHTRAMIRQPGAAVRLTAVYRYLIQAARTHLGSHPAPLAACPACEHDEAAVDRALGIIFDGLTGIRPRKPHPRLEGLCLPHLNALAARNRRRALRRLLQALAVRPAGEPPSIEALAGGPDYDADERDRLRAMLPRGPEIPAGSCLVCLTAARAELRQLAWAATASHPTAAGRQACLCAAHLRDVTAMNPGNASVVLERQSRCQTDAVIPLLSRRLRLGSMEFRGAVARHRLLPGTDICPICAARDIAAQRAMERCKVVPQASPPGHDGTHRLCVLHVLSMRAADPSAGHAAAQAAILRADALIEELSEAFRKNTWARRHEPRGPEMAAWQRAAAFLDGRIFGGCPAPGR